MIMGSGGGGGGTDPETERLNKQNMLLQQKQQLLLDKKTGQEQYEADLSEWEAGELLKAKRAAGAARRTGGSIFEKGDETGRPEEFDSSDIDNQIADLEAQIDALNKPKSTAPPSSSSSAQSGAQSSARGGRDKPQRRQSEKEKSNNNRPDPTRNRGVGG